MITKLKTHFDFDSAHRLAGYKGKCSNLHGHIWKVEVEVEGEKLNDIGILCDFSNVKKIKEQLDHKTILKVCKENQDLVYTLTRTCGSDSLFLMHDNPTAENLAKYILDTFKVDNPSFKFLIRVWESPKSYAEVEE